jgi:hypothetical protein
MTMRGILMKEFKVFKHPNLGFQAVKIGFSWPGFFVTPIWAAQKEMWGYAFAVLGMLIFLFMIQLAFAAKQNNGAVILMVLSQLMVFIVVGVQGNEWRLKNLEKRGFKLVGTVQAITPDAAIDHVAT